MSAVSSHAPIMEHSPISPEDILFFQQAIALADQTLKLSSVGPLCPATEDKATELKESAHEGLFPDSRTNERYTADYYRCNVRNHTRDLLGYFKDEAKFHDLIAELCQIFREHYVLKYMDRHMDDLPVVLHKLCGVRSDSYCVDYIRTRTNPTWDELLRGMQEETLLMSNYESALRDRERELEKKQKRELERGQRSTPRSWKSTDVNLSVPAVEPWDSTAPGPWDFLASGIPFSELCGSFAPVSWDSSAPGPWDPIVPEPEDPTSTGLCDSISLEASDLPAPGLLSLAEDRDLMARKQNSILPLAQQPTSIIAVPTTGSWETNEDPEPAHIEQDPASSPVPEPSPPPVRPLTPSTDTIKRIAHLFCEDEWTDREYGQERADFLQILKENTPSGRRQRDFNRYTDKLLRGEYNAMAGHLRSDRNLLTTRLHRAEDASLRSILSDAVDKKEKSLFLVNKYVFNGYDDPFWRVYPTKEAVEMSVFQDYWEQRPRRRTDGEDDPFGIPDMGLGPFSW
ncbi:hypothetical protein CGCSCA2_v011530 [Colletotrichum siamense]|uniref:Uncharacterized protein n=1 Tax=Colletotrichum siamense TaxID=690259 RepID=A0A9P5EKA6_COLSI|nr:hypothetical protein CGCSCA2_v011530 [Colletotrichum siamense]